MGKKTYIAQNRICGIEPPTVNQKTKERIEHVIEAGDEYSMDDADAAPFVAGGSLKLKPGAQAKKLPGDDPLAGDL